jgi:chromosome segregation ATPase
MNPIIVASDYDRLQSLLELLKNPAEVSKQLVALRDAQKNAEGASKLADQKRAEVERTFRAGEDLQRRNIQNAGELMARAKKIEELEAAHADAVAKHVEAVKNAMAAHEADVRDLKRQGAALDARVKELDAREAALAPKEKGIEAIRRDVAARVSKVVEQENALRARQQLLASRLTLARDSLGV